MIEPVADVSPASLARFDDALDVRSPAEFAEDRIPGARNMPALEDAERAEVGTIYARASRFRARRIGAAMIARNVARCLDGPLAEKPANYRPLLYCWRGGMRSRAVATILSEIGWRVGVLAGGYRTWRRAVVADLRDSDAPLNLILVDGQTGTAKSRIIQRLAEIGAQTLDLEAAAAHRGSVFGATAAAQPSQKFFESMLFAALSRIDPARPIIVEAESNRIGRLVVPKRIWRAMNASPRVEITAPPEARARYLVTAYAELLHDCTTVVAAIDRLAPFHSKETVESWRELARQGAFEALALDLMRKHYDPRYDRSRKLRADRPLIEVRLERLDEEAVDAAAEHLAEFAVKTLEPAGCRAG